MKLPISHLHAAALALLASAALALPARAEWARVASLPAADIYTVDVKGDTVSAGVDQAVWVSTDHGATWTRSADLPGVPVTVEATRFAGGRLWAGTYGQGVFSSTNLGASWQSHSQGLAGGLFNSHLYVVDFEERGDSLFAATDGAGVYVLRPSVAGAWSAFGSAFVDGAAGAVADLEVRGGRLVAPAGGNGLVFHNDRGEGDWTESFLNNFGPAPGLQARRVAWTGSAWIASTRLGCYRSADGTSPWTAIGPAGGGRTDGLVVSDEQRTYAAFNTLSGSDYHHSLDEGTTWEPLETVAAYTYELAMLDAVVLAARTDGLWMRAPALGVPAAHGATHLGLRLAGANPVRGRARLRFALAAAGTVRLEVFDVGGRRVGPAIERGFGPGGNEIEWEAAGRPAGIYVARLSTDAGQAAAKLVVAR